MNCRQGDIAMIIYSLADNEGKVVICLEFVGRRIPHRSSGAEDFWRVDTPIRCLTEKGKPSLEFSPYVSDSCLRPMRPTGEIDEMLIIAGLPWRGF